MRIEESCVLPADITPKEARGLRGAYQCTVRTKPEMMMPVDVFK
jgi:hypothetical protein